MRVLVAALAVAVTAGVGWFTVGPGAAAPLDACTAPAGTVARSVDEHDGPTARWGAPTNTNPAPDNDDEEIVDVESFRDGFVAIGNASNGPEHRAVILVSQDGETWESAMLQAGFAGTEFRRVRVVGDRLFALGTTSIDDRGGSRAAVWISDDGLRWRPSSGSFHDATVASVAGDDGGLLLVGSRADASAPLAWRSDDGEQWTEVPMRLPVEPRVASFADLAATDGRWLAVGSISRGPDADSTAVAWRSDDGETWACEVLGNDANLRTAARELHRGPGGWLVVGDASRGCGFGASCIGFQIVWSSIDGRWTDGRAPGAAADAGEPSPMLGNAAYARADAGFVAVGGGTWLSETGVHWTLLDARNPPGIVAVAANGNRLAAGGSTSDADGNADAWLAPGHLDQHGAPER